MTTYLIGTWPTPQLQRIARAVLTIVLLAVSAIAIASPVISPPAAHADESQYEEFYTPPDPLPDGAPGSLIRSEPSRLVLEPSGQLGAFVATGTRIMYRSTDAQGNPTAVTGTYFEPDNPGQARVRRPLIAFAAGPYGMGEQCAPSRMFNQGIHFSQGFDLWFGYEEGFVATMVARGFAVVVTDGEGLGIHRAALPQFLNRIAAGTTLLDAARAAMQLPGTSLDPHGPVALWGNILRRAGLGIGGRAGAHLCTRSTSGRSMDRRAPSGFEPAAAIP